MAFSNNQTINGYIRAYRRDGLQKFFDYQFANAYITFFKEHINTRDNSPVINKATVSEGIIRRNEAVFENYWNPNNPFVKQAPVITTAESPTEQKAKKEPFRVELKAQNSDLKNGVFGFDTILIKIL